MQPVVGTGSAGSHGSGRASRAALEWIALTSALMVLAAALVAQLASSRREIEANQAARLEHQAGMVEKMLGTRLQATSNALESLRGDLPALLARPDGIARMNERMQVMVSSMVGVRTFVLVDADGNLVASNRKELIGTNWRDGERYRIIRARPDAAMLYVSPPFMTPLGNWALNLGRVVLDSQGRFDGYLLAIIDPAYFTLLLESARYAPDMSASIVHGAGKIILRVPDTAGAIGKNVADNPDSAFSRHLRSGEQRSVLTAPLTTTGVENLVVLQDVRPTASPSDGFLVAVFSRETEAIFAAWRRERRDRLALFGVVAVASVVALALHQRRRAQSAQLQAQIDRSARLAAMGTLVAGVAHEINNPLSGLTASAGTALEEMREFREDVRNGAVPDRAQLLRHADDLTEMLADVGAGAERISHIVSDLTILGRPVKETRRIRLGDVVQAALRRLPVALAQRATIRTELGDAPEVMASAGQVEQVLVNLVGNAILSFPEGRGGTVVVRLGPGGAGARLEVADDGPGIAPELRERIFEPFFTTRGPGKGTGLGLSICSAIVGAHGGTISLESQVGKGTTFRVDLPAAPAAA